MSVLHAWLDRLIPLQADGPSLVLCRTSATLASVRGWAAQKGGVLGFEVATPWILAAQLGEPLLGPPPPPDVLPSHPWVQRLRDRPGLLTLARAHTHTIRRILAAEPDRPVPEGLRALAESGWSPSSSAAIRLLELARRNGPRLTPSLQWSRVIPIGFDAPLDPYERALLEALTGRAPPPPAPADDLPSEAIRVPDPAAEARVAARLVRHTPEDALVLVQHDATAARIHRALTRNGIPSAWRGSIRLDRHGLATAIRRCLPWFDGSDDPRIRAVDLHAIFRHPALRRDLPPPAARWLEACLTSLGADPTRLGLSPRAATRSIERCRHLEAPLSRWLAETDALRHTEEAPLDAHMARLHARLGVLQACVRGMSFAEQFGVDAPEEDWEAFDALLHELLEPEPNTLPPPGTIGALRRFLLALRVRGFDEATRQILGALRRGAERPANRATVRDLLTGAVERPVCTRGVEILHYDDYDGRPASTLVLCDVHDRGVAAPPRPDPLLDDRSLRALGLPGAEDRVAHRLQQLRSACARAEHATALICRHDAAGRVVVAPIQLRLSIRDSTIAPYGLNARLPEIEALDALRVRPADPDWSPSKDPLGHAAVQASAEWWRHGRGPTLPPRHPKPIPGVTTLTHLLHRQPRPAPWLAPYLGDARVPEACLTDEERGVTSFFEPLTRCMYQAFAKAVLRLEEPSQLREELDPREIGTAVHTTLEIALARWFTLPPDKRSQDALITELRRINRETFAAERERFGTLSPVREAATRGLEARWSQHLERWARSRFGSEEEVSREQLRTSIALHHRFEPLLDAIGKEQDLCVWQAKRVLHGLLERGERPPIRWTHDRATMWEVLLRAWREMELHARAVGAPWRGIVTELRFGADSGASILHTVSGSASFEVGPVRLTLHEQEVDVRGAIDRVVWVERDGMSLLRILDYKTGPRTHSYWAALRQLLSLRKPQLVLYALALRETLAAGRIPGLEGARIATVGWDHLRAHRRGKLEEPRDRYLLDSSTLDLLGRAIRYLLEQARSGSWHLLPLPDACPNVERSWGAEPCPFAPACRLRALPEEPEA